jgi:hypothetical protein
MFFWPWLGLKAVALAWLWLQKLSGRPEAKPARYGFYQGIEGDFWLWPWYQSQKAVAPPPEARARETLFVKAFFSTSFDQNLLPRLPIVHSNREPRYSLLIISITLSL